MIRHTALSLLLSIISLAVSGQTKPSFRDYNTWNVGASVGLTYPRTDIAGQGGSIALSIDATRFLSRNFGVQFRFINAHLKGEDENNTDYKYSTTIHYDLTLNAVFQSNSLIHSSTLPDKFALYATVGAGLIHYSPDIWLDGGFFTLHGLYSQYYLPFDTFDYRNSVDFIIPVSIGAKYRISERVSINAEFSYRSTNTDRIDGLYKLLSSNDSYAILSAGVVIHLGHKGKTLEWERPAGTSTQEIDQLNAKLIKLQRDSDNDGVSDYNDKEPNTPSGNRVYGDGTSVDSDGDKVPDATDAEPFSGKNVKVDANGREIKQAIPAQPTPVQTIEKPRIDTVPSTLFSPVYFGYDSARINKSYFETLGKIALTIKYNPTQKYRIIAICDDGKKYNIRLSNRRAENVKNHLIQYYNVKPEQLSIEVKIIDRGNTPKGENRRVEVRQK